MIKKTGLDWEKVSWSDFQKLCIHFTQNELPELRLEDYLKQGNDQKGIDLHSMKPNGGRYTFIQCKHEKSLPPTKLTSIINEFLEKDLVSQCGDFIVITTADLQNKKSKDHQNQLKVSIKKSHNIDLQFWDRNFLETQLQNYYSIVEIYFGQSDANEYCHSKSSPPKIIEKPNDYIERRLEEYNKPLFTFLDDEDTQYIEIENLFNANRLTPKRIVILGEAHSGKSMQMQNALYNLSNFSSYQPILIDLKQFNVQEVSRSLEISYSNWKKTPAKDLIIALDGLDEVPTEQFLQQVKYINAFAMENPNISLILCCRRLFFDHYDLIHQLDTFDVFELKTLGESSVNQYLIQQLGLSIDLFNKKIYNVGISDYLYSPFYLVQLVKSYKENPSKIPDNKISILESFIDATLQNTQRNINGKLLKRQSLKYNRTIQKLAFSFQLAGTNAFTHEDIQWLFNDEEILLLQNSSIVDFRNNVWSFTNALYQEHLAAQYLISLSFDEIIKYSTNGVRVKKIKTKWLQTISSVFSLIDESSLLFEPLIEFVKKDNIEIIFKAEGTKFSSNQMINFLILLIEKLKIYNNRLQLVSDSVIASFINSQPKAKDYCIKLLDNDLSTPIKTVLVRVLKNVDLSEIQITEVKAKIYSEIFNTSDDFYANQLLELSAEFNLATEEFIVRLTQSPLNNKHEFRDGVYQNILKLKLSDCFYDYALEGIPILVEHNREVSHYGSYHFLEKVLVSFNTSINARKLLHSLNEQNHFSFFERSISKKISLKTLNGNLVEVYKSDMMILFPILKLIKKLGREFTKNEYESLFDFFSESNSNLIALKIVFYDFKNFDLWHLGYLFRENCFDFIFNEFEENNISIDELSSVYFAIKNYGYKKVADKFMLMCKALTENNFPPKRIPIRDNYERYEGLRKRNDQLFLTSKDSFRKGLINYLNLFKNDDISKSELFINHNSPITKQKANSLVIYHFLIRNQPWDIIGKELAIRHFEEMDFEFFQIEEILWKYGKEEILANDTLLNIIKQYYYKKLPTCNFYSTYFSKANNDGEIEHWQHTLEIKIAEVFRKFEFDTPVDTLIEMLYADNGGVKNFEHHSLNNEKSLSEVILSKISEGKLDYLKQKILENISSDISANGVLENHIGLCRHLKILEAKDIVYNALSNMFTNNRYTTSYSIDEIIDIYLELGGDIQCLIPLIRQIQDYNAYCFIYIAKKLEDLYSFEIIPILKEALNGLNTSYERKFELAHILTSMGELDGFKFIVSHIKIYKGVSNRNLREINFKNLDTSQFLAEIDEVCYLIIDNSQSKIHWTESGQGILKKWILSIAAKGENDLILVNDFLIKKSEELKATHERFFDLQWYRMLALENFRDFETNNLDVKQILSSFPQTFK